MDAVASDHPSIETVRATVSRHGNRRRLDLPDEAGVAIGVLRAETDAGTRFVRIDTVAEAPAIVGLYETARAARETDVARDCLGDWLTAADLEPGRTALVDVIEPEAYLGLRRPGERLVYPVFEPADDGLDDIASRFFDT